MDDQQEATGRTSVARLAEAATVLAEIAAELAAPELDGIQIINFEINAGERAVQMHAYSGASPHLVAEALGLAEISRKPYPGDKQVLVKWQGLRGRWAVTVVTVYTAEAVAS